jgi:geranylgeranyl pyrophosphate synthase
MTNELALLELVHGGLERVEQKMRAISSVTYAPLVGAFMQLLGSGGKRLRPALTLAADRVAGGAESEKTIAVAAAVETLHTATLVHDDLIDGARIRRGNTTLNAVWTRSATVLAGDYIFARAASLSAETENIRVIQIFAETLEIICEGELRQMLSSKQWRQPKDAYYPRIFAKTASLFASATQFGAILAGANQEDEKALRDYGLRLGMAFQIVDDILDYTGVQAVLGKPVGGDLRQGIVTLPLFYYLSQHPNPDRVVARLDGNTNGNGDAVAELVGEIRSSDAIKQAFAEARRFTEEAKESLAMLPDGPHNRALLELADFVVAREI